MTPLKEKAITGTTRTLNTLTDSRALKNSGRISRVIFNGTREVNHEGQKHQDSHQI